MFARVTTQHGSPDKLDAALQVVNEQVVPAAKRLSGFERMLVLVDRASGKTLAVTLWDSEEAMQASEDAAGSMRSSAAEASGADDVGVERFEVVVDATP